MSRTTTFLSPLCKQSLRLPKHAMSLPLRRASKPNSKGNCFERWAAPRCKATCLAVRCLCRTYCSSFRQALKGQPTRQARHDGAAFRRRSGRRTRNPPELCRRADPRWRHARHRVGAYEEYIYDSKGHMENPGFLDYRIPVASDLPMIEPVLVEVPNPAHPYGAKGAAEVNICPPMAAIANAIERAVGRRLTELPMSPPKVLAAIDAHKQA